MPAPSSCEICFDAVPEESTDAKLVTQFCSKQCPATICTACLKQHVSVAMQVPYAGALPKVRCPMCLVPVNKQRWSKYLDPADASDVNLLTRYRQLSEKACTFRTSCCDNPDYSHLPSYYEDYHWGRRSALRGIMMSMSQKRRVPDLRRLVRRFCNHDKTVAARGVVESIDDWFSPEATALAVLESTLARIEDEERRAALLLSYHSAHRRILTLCCHEYMCFNCKRASAEDPDEITQRMERSDAYEDNDELEGLCECEAENRGANEVIDMDNCIVQCRSCRVMLVKVEGCDDVRCPCGFRMRWDDELACTRQNQKKLLPIDPFNVALYEWWKIWHSRILSVVPPIRAEFMVRSGLQEAEKIRPGFREFLRRFVWRWRLKRLHPVLLRTVRNKYVGRVHPIFKETLRMLIWRRRARLVLLSDLRETFCKHVARHRCAVLWRLIRGYLWRRYFTQQVLVALRAKLMWQGYWDTHQHEQEELQEEAFGFLAIGLEA